MQTLRIPTETETYWTAVGELLPTLGAAPDVAVCDRLAAEFVHYFEHDRFADEDVAGVVPVAALAHLRAAHGLGAERTDLRAAAVKLAGHLACWLENDAPEDRGGGALDDAATQGPAALREAVAALAAFSAESTYPYGPAEPA